MIGNIIGSLGVCFYKAPIFTLICFSYFPMILLIMGFVGNLSKKASVVKLDDSKSLAGFTEETLSLYKLIVTFGQENEIIKEYKLKT